MRGIFLSLLLFLASLFASPAALAHTLTFAVYSKYEATTSGNQLALVYALDKKSILQLIKERAANRTIDVAELGNYHDFFSQYLFERFTVTNNGEPCSHPPTLFKFAWDDKSKRILAVTRFTCSEELDKLKIRSAVTHDLTTSHSTMGDLQHGLALVRHRFVEDRLDGQHVLSSLPQTHRTFPKRSRARNRFSYVAVPDTKRRYENLAREVLAHATGHVKPSGDVMAKDDVPASSASFGSTFLQFVGVGIWHILTGLDHILFVITLVLTIRTWKQLLMVVTSFTVAHSLTLVGATLGIITIAPGVVEPAIAASVLFVAIDAVLRPEALARMSITFAFGLLHGFGFSSFLLDLDLNGGSTSAALVGFNLGVELGQLAIVAPFFLLMSLLRRQKEPLYQRVRVIFCVLVALLALYWLITRIIEQIG